MGFKMVVNTVISGAVRSPAGQRGSQCVAAARPAAGGRAGSARGRRGAGSRAGEPRPWRRTLRGVSCHRPCGDARGCGEEEEGDAAGLGPGASGVREVPVRPAPQACRVPL